MDRFVERDLKIIAIIVNRSDGDRAVKYLKERRFLIQFTCMARGSQGSALMDYLGFGSTDKTLLICVAPGHRIDTLLAESETGLGLKKAGKGIAFTVPLEGVCLPGNAGQTDAPRAYETNYWQKADHTDGEVGYMGSETSHCAILAIIDKGNSEELITAAKAAGARGGTIVDARRTGEEDTIKFFGLTVQREKEIVAILTARDKRQAIIDGIGKSFGLDSPAHGIILSVPVDGVAGM